MTGTSNPPPEPSPTVDYLDISEPFVDGLGGAQLRNGVAKLNFYAIRRRKDGSDEPVPAATLVMNVIDFGNMVAGLSEIVQKLQQQGVLVPVNAGSGNSNA